MLTGRERWFADVLHAGLETRVLSEPEILVHVTPAVLAKTMPRDILVKMFDSALATGTVSPETIVKTITPELLAEHAPSKLLWECIVAGAERAGIVRGTTDKSAREFLRRTIDAGLRTAVMMPDEVLRHADPKVLVNSLPDALTAKLIEASLFAGRMNPELIVETLGVEELAAHVPTEIIWACILDVGQVSEETVTPEAAKLAQKPKVKLDYMDDDIVSMHIDADEPEPAPTLSKETSKEPVKAQPTASKN